MTATWLGTAREELATTRILDAAGQLFACDGVASVGMAEVAAAAGCSRATLYRYFPNRDALRGAFVRREARRLGDKLARRAARSSDPAKRLETAVLGAVDAVRADPVLAAWFGPESAGIATDLAGASEVIEALAAGFLADLGAAGADAVADPDTARWVVRGVVSLLSMPGRDRAEERRFVQRVLVSAVLG
jgi:AcrR family transcriptional regulator